MSAQWPQVTSAVYLTTQNFHWDMLPIALAKGAMTVLFLGEFLNDRYSVCQCQVGAPVGVNGGRFTLRNSSSGNKC